MTIKAKRKVREGLVTSDKMDKTITVKVERSVRHPLYKRTIRRSVTFKAHDEKNECKTGDKVRIVETRPLSATKRWRLLEVVERAKMVGSVAV
jgi:small subunit ribosomal protein S17